jgi:hypothetical protein
MYHHSSMDHLGDWDLDEEDRGVGVYIVMVGTEYRPYLSWTDCNLKVEVDPG